MWWIFPSQEPRRKPNYGHLPATKPLRHPVYASPPFNASATGKRVAGLAPTAAVGSLRFRGVADVHPPPRLCGSDSSASYNLKIPVLSGSQTSQDGSLRQPR